MTIPLMFANLPQNVKLLPLIGAGVSMSVTDTTGAQIYPSWKGVLQLAAERLNRNDKIREAKGLIAMVELDMFQAAADIAKRGLPGAEWNTFLREIFDAPSERIDLQSLSLLKAIWKISNRVITLNYDKALRYACPSPSVTEFDNTNSSALADFLRADDNRYFLWHLHGMIDNVPDMVFTSEGYRTLYSADDKLKAAISTLRTVCAVDRLLFVGCSLSDAEILLEISTVSDIFEKNVGPHYAIVHSAEVDRVTRTLQGLPFEIISFKNYGHELESMLPTAKINTNSLASPVRAYRKIAQKTRAAVLVCNAIDCRNDKLELMKELRKFKFDLHFMSLNAQNLNSLEDFQYLFIISSTQRGKMMIEDEWLVSQRIEIDELIASIGDSNLLGVIVLLDSYELDPNSLARLKSVNIPLLLLADLSKSDCSSLGFKIFKRNKFDINEGAIIINPDRFFFADANDRSQEFSNKTALPDSIDPRSLRGLVGRRQDLQTLCKRALDSNNFGDVIVVKGAGGIGKTSLVKSAAIEFATRGLFSDGIHLIDCEFVADMSAFGQQVGRAFDLQSAEDLKGTMRKYRRREDRLVMLDNAETLLSLSERPAIMDLIGFIADYCVVVVTSRELLRISNENVIELRQLTTDEAVELFLRELSIADLSQSEILFVRERIVEDLLDNNPLAIKLVTRNTPKGKDLRILRAELEKDIFSRVCDDGVDIFDSVADRNVERKRSLYASINYSYSHLNDRERIAFEILSLFPDGINMESFKRVSERSRQTTRRDSKLENNPAKQFLVNDALIKSLESKSVIEIDNDRVSLQSLVGRFADHMFSRRTPSDIKRFRKSAFDYNDSVLNALVELSDSNKFAANTFFWDYQKNFLKALSFSTLTSSDNNTVLYYIANMSVLCIRTCSHAAFLEAVRAVQFPAENIRENEHVELSKLAVRYFAGEFDRAFSEVRAKYSFDYLSSLDTTSELDRSICGSALWIYTMEGFLFDVIRMAHAYQGNFNGIPEVMFQLGEFDERLILRSGCDFSTFDAKLAIGKLAIADVDNYLDGLHKQQHLERIQVVYLRVKLTGDPKVNVDSLVTVNPYTVGIKRLIAAICSEDYAAAKDGFEAAILQLVHIKYYYVEAILKYSEFLKIHGNLQEFSAMKAKGLALAEHHGYRFLAYKFIELQSGALSDYVADANLLPAEINKNISTLLELELKRAAKK